MKLKLIILIINSNKTDETWNAASGYSSFIQRSWHWFLSSSVDEADTAFHEAMNRRSGHFRRLFRYCHFQHLVGLKQHLQSFCPFAHHLHPSSDVLRQLRCINNQFLFPLKCSVFVLLLLCWRTKTIIAIYPFYQIQSGFGHRSVLSHHFHLVTFQTINK